MVTLAPFVALRPTADHVIRSVDGDRRQAARLAQRTRHPRHVGWLEPDEDDGVADVDRWIDEGALVEDDAPRLRIVEQGLVDDTTVVGVLAAAALADLVPHEATDEAAVRRRLARDRRQQVETRPLLAVLPADPRGLWRLVDEVRSGPAELDVVDELGTRHRMWSCPTQLAASIVRSVATTPCLLADGHHRAAAASLVGRTSAMALVALATAAPRLMPVWRIGELARGTAPAVHRWMDRLPAGTDVSVTLEGRHRLVGGDGVELPVEASHRLATAAPGVTSVTSTAVPTSVAVAERDGALVVGAAAPTVTDVLSAVAAGRPLPPKSTAFHPKPRAGLVLRRL